MNKLIAFPAEFQIAARTHAGVRRTNNEDAVVVNPGYGLAILADGMGGYNAGEVASSIATAVIQVMMEEALQRVDWNTQCDASLLLGEMMCAAIRRANQQILQAATHDAQFKGMGTTVVMGLFYHGTVMVAHVGDSRMYRFREGCLSLLTRDHSFLQEQIDAGLVSAEAARLSPHRNLLTRAVGMRASLEIERRVYSTRAGDQYLLCSDGISDMLSAQEIAVVLARYGASVERACDELINSANEHGGIDNSSVILVRIAAQNHSPFGFRSRAPQHPSA